MTDTVAKNNAEAQSTKTEADLKKKVRAVSIKSVWVFTSNSLVVGGFAARVGK